MYMPAVSAGGADNTVPMSAVPERYYPIVSLDVLHSNRWPIVVRVTKKSGLIRSAPFDPTNNQTTYFTLNFIDEESSEIHAFVEREECQRFYGLIHVDKVYAISEANVLYADQSMSSLGNNFVLQFNNKTKVDRVLDDNKIPRPKHWFPPIIEVLKMAPGSYSDIIAVATMIGREVDTTGHTKREVYLSDPSGSVTLTIWADMTRELDETSDSPVIAFRGVRVEKRGDCTSVTTVPTTIIRVNPTDIRRTWSLRRWQQSIASYHVAVSNNWAFSPSPSKNDRGWLEWKTIAQVYQEDLARATYSSVMAVARVENVRDPFYQACAALQSCGKKVTELPDGSYHCSRCNATKRDFKWRLRIRIELADGGGSLLATCFSPIPETITGKTTNELHDMYVTNPGEFDNLIRRRIDFQSFVFRLKATGRDVIVNRLCLINLAEYCRRMLNDLNMERNNRLLPLPTSPSVRDFNRPSTSGTRPAAKRSLMNLF